VAAHQVGGDVLNAFADQAASQTALSQQAAEGSDSDELPWAGALPAPVRGQAGDRDTRRPEPAEQARRPRSIKAKYAGTCRRCGAPYKAGELIASGTQGWGHPACATAEGEDARGQ
jgi:ribonuclease HI